MVLLADDKLPRLEEETLALFQPLQLILGAL